MERKKNKVCNDLRKLGQHMGHHLHDKRMTNVRHNDTIYVVFTFLLNMTIDAVVISRHPFNVQPAINDAIPTLLDSLRVVVWFCQNLRKYGGDNLYHAKVHPFP